ncbi:MAG: hypothetical protein MRY78_11510 [Saprospiraceae bacterium]|nr:hypothetical protein [Saprospiraceae bacterium]
MHNQYINVLFLILLASFYAKSQSFVTNVSNYNHIGMINPAFFDTYYIINGVENDKRHTINFYHRHQQFKGYEGLPQDVGINYQGTYNSKYLFGGGIYGQKLGALNTTKFNIKFALLVLGGANDNRTNHSDSRIFIGIGIDGGESYIQKNILTIIEKDDRIFSDFNFTKNFYWMPKLGVMGRIFLGSDNYFIFGTAFSGRFEKLSINTPFEKTERINLNTSFLIKTSKGDSNSTTKSLNFLEIALFNETFTSIFTKKRNILVSRFDILSRFYLKFGSDSNISNWNLQNDYLSIGLGVKNMNFNPHLTGNIFFETSYFFYNFLPNCDFGVNFSYQTRKNKFEGLQSMSAYATRITFVF